VFRPRRSLGRRIALIFAVAVAGTAITLALSAYFITKTAQEDDELDRILTQSRFYLFLADAMLPEAPQAEDYSRLRDALATRGDFSTLILAGTETYISGFQVNTDLVSPELAAKVSEGRIGYQDIRMDGEPTIAVGGQVHGGDITLYFFFPQGGRLADLARLRNILAIGGSILAVLGAAGGWVLARGLLGPVGRASRAAYQMSQGDLDIRLRPGSDELGVLASSFNTMAEKLQAKMLDLEAGQARERRFVADVTHELRTPVAALVGEASLLRARIAASSESSAEVLRLAELVSADITRLRQLVDDLLEISRLEAKAADIFVEPIELGSFLARLGQARDWPKTVELEQPSQEYVIQTDKRRLERIVINLVENALRHGAPPIKVVLVGPSGRAADSEALRVVVTDRGPGIPPNDLPHVFDRFYKADPSRSASRGSGLGLAIAMENARLLGGDLSASNRPEGGACFALALPAALLVT